MTFEINTEVLAAELKALEEDLQPIFSLAVDAAGQLLEDEYRALLQKLNLKAPKPGNKSFHPAFTTVCRKTSSFQDGTTGAFTVIGTQQVGGQMLAPQVRFDEAGTDERYTKMGQYRGKVAARNWLRSVFVQHMAEAEARAIKVLQAYVNRS